MARTPFKKILLTFFLAIAATCYASPVMTKREFYEIELGTSIEAVVKKYGKPYSIQSKKDGSQEYLFIERIPVQEQIVEQNNYTLVIKNGQVVSKQYKQERPSVYDELYDDDPNDVPN